MSERAISLLACPDDFDNPAPALGWLTPAEGSDCQNPAARFLVVNSKFNVPSGIRTFNIEANYPAELARLATHATWSSPDNTVRRQYRDARALFCLCRFAHEHPDAREITLLIGEPRENRAIMRILSSTPAKSPFLRPDCTDQYGNHDDCQIIHFDRNNPYAETALKVAVDIALSGAIYSIEPYSLGALLDQATNAASVLATLSSKEEG